MKTLVIGGTGTIGTIVREKLAARGVAVRCMARSVDKMRDLPAGVEGCAADLDKPETLGTAFEGVDNVFLLVAVDPNEVERGISAVQAAKSAGVKKIVYLSVFLPEGSAVIPHFGSKILIENAVKESGIVFTILRPNNFFQNDLALERTLTQYGIYTAPLGSIGLNRIDARDVAEAAVNALTMPGHDNETYSIHGRDTLTGPVIARIYSRFLGRIVRYNGNDLDAWEQQVKNVMPDWRVRELRVMYKFFQDRGMVAPRSDLERQQLVIGRLPRSFEDFVREITAQWKEEAARAA